MYVIEVEINSQIIRGICPGREDDGSIMVIEQRGNENPNQLWYSGVHFIKKDEYVNLIIKDSLDILETFQVYETLSEGSKRFFYSFYAKEFSSVLSPQFREFVYEYELTFEELVLLEHLFRIGEIRETVVGLELVEDGERLESFQYQSKTDIEEFRELLQNMLHKIKKLQKNQKVVTIQTLFTKLEEAK